MTSAAMMKHTGDDAVVADKAKSGGTGGTTDKNSKPDLAAVAMSDGDDNEDEDEPTPPCCSLGEMESEGCRGSSGSRKGGGGEDDDDDDEDDDDDDDDDDDTGAAAAAAKRTLDIVAPPSGGAVAAAAQQQQQQQQQQHQQQQQQQQQQKPHIGFFERWLTLWVMLCMVAGTLLGYFVPSIPAALEKATVANIWLPGSVLVWLMVYPMTLGVRWSAIREIPKHPGGILLTTVVNWAVQPFAMYGLAVLFFNVLYADILDPATQDQYVAGAVILGGSPCTAMVFVWSSLASGDPNYTLAQVLINDLILLVLYVPTVQLLLGVSGIPLPWDTVFLSVVLFVVVPFALGLATQLVLLRRGDEDGNARLEQVQRFFHPVSAGSLLLLVLFIFVTQAQTIVGNYGDSLLIMVPLLLQTATIFAFTYSLAYLFRLPHSVAGPAAFIGSSNFFELAVAVAITVYGPKSGAVLVTVIGVLVEVPVMLLEVVVVNATRERFDARARWLSGGGDRGQGGAAIITTAEEAAAVAAAAAAAAGGSRGVAASVPDGDNNKDVTVGHTERGSGGDDSSISVSAAAAVAK